MKLELDLDPEANQIAAATEHLQGLRVFVSTFCPEHKIAVIIAYKPDNGLDVGCTLAKLQAAVGLVLDQANAPGGM